MKQILFIIIFSIFFCCSNHKKHNFQELNGFWLIEKVIAPNGEKKFYKNVEEFDFFGITFFTKPYKISIVNMTI